MGLSQAELRAIATLDGSQFKAGMAEIKGSVKEFATGGIKELGAMIGGAFAIGAVVEFGRALMTEAAANERFSKSVGISAAMLDELGDKAAETGADAQGFSQKIVKMIEAQEKAITGDEKMVAAFAKLGISMSQLTSMTPEQLLLAVAQGAQNDATAIHNLNEVMGKGAAAEYGATLKDLAENGLPSVSEEAARAETRFAAMNRQMEIMKDKAGHKFMEIITATGPGAGALEGIGMGAGTGAYLGAKFGPQGALIGAGIGGIVGGIGGALMGKVNQDAAAEAEAQLKEEAANRSRMAQQRLMELKAEHAASIEKIKLDAKDKTDAVDKKRAKAIDDITVSGPKAASGMAEYGRMIGGSYGGGNGVAERQLKELEVIAKYAEESAKIADDTAKKIQELGGE